ncbi:SusC/RagA family TonB-linked outer membrane protein [Ornithobacterium rhinotracheale]|uniref:SusC/RagA family TonB-linked outer membrane protein n=1 Tax=Ornithobacterium rhinotracheale TaxID=28251 RepID=UPI003FA42505
MRSKNLWIFIFSLFLCSYAFAQEKIITGKVIDDSGFPLVDAYVYVDGSTDKGVYTDGDGNYKISARQGDKITFDFIGFDSKTVPVGTKSTINVKLKKGGSVNLKELVAVGYGVSTQEALTGSAALVKKDQLEKSPAVNLEKALQSVSPGVQVVNVGGSAGSGATIRLRGIGSLTASSDPLWVVDGVVGAPRPNMEDVKSITILKDAASASIYGSRAANGVILVTTKGGKQGRTDFIVQAKYGVSTKTSNKFKLMNAADFYQTSWRGLYASALQKGKNAQEAVAYANQNLEGFAGRNPFNLANPFDANGNILPDAKLMINEDWMNLAFRAGSTRQYDISANGGNENTKFYMSLGYYNQDGIVKPDDYTRYSFQANVSNQVTDKIKIGLRANLRRTEGHGVDDVASLKSTGYAAFVMPNNVSLYQLDDKFQIIRNAEGKPLYNWGGNKINPDYNPIGLAELNKYYSKTTTAFGSVNFNYKILENLVFDTNFSGDYSNDRSGFFESKLHGDARNVDGRSAKEATEYFRYLGSTTLTYDKNFGEKHHVNAMIGHEFEDYKSEYLMARAIGYEFDFSSELSVGTSPEKVGSSTAQNRMIGVFSRFNYDYGSKYYTSFSIRRDASAKFAPDNRWGTFWSASAAWRLSQENFLKNAKWINNLKLKGSYGTSGNSNIESYLYMPLYALGGNYNGQTGLVHSQLANPYLRWEKNAMTNIGLEFGLFGFLDGTIEWFNRSSKDLLMDKPLPYSTGWSSRTENVGAMKNTGIEFQLSSRNIKTENFSWDTRFNITHYKNEITELTQDKIIRGGSAKVWTVGDNAYTWYMKDYAGVNKQTGAAQWYRDVEGADGKVTKEITESYANASYYKLGSSLPKFYGGLDNNFNYKGVNLSIQLYYSFGSKIYNNLDEMTMGDGSEYGYQLNDKMRNSWRPDNTDTDIPQFVYNNTSNANARSSRFLNDGSYVRIKNVELSYDIPKDYLQKAGIQSTRVFINADNVYTFTKYDGLDPEQGINGFNDYSVIPNIRTITFGVRLGL